MTLEDKIPFTNLHASQLSTIYLVADHVVPARVGHRQDTGVDLDELDALAEGRTYSACVAQRGALMIRRRT